MLDHANICWTIECLRLALPFSSEGFRIVSYLPMAHIAERVTTHYGGVANGYEVTTCPDLHFLASYLGETRPELLFGVPRTYEKIHSGIRAVLAADPAKNAEFDRALAVGLEVDAARVRGDDRRRRARARVRARPTRALLGPVRQLLGLDAVRVAVTAAAPIPVEILQFFRALGLPLSEMYGLSESSGPATWAAERVRLGTVGRAIPGVELRLGDDGEVIAARRERVPRLPRRPRPNRRGARRRRLAAHRRHRRARRRRLPAHRRPQEGAHHHRGRQEHLAGEPRSGAQGATVDRAGGRDRRRPGRTSSRCSCSTPTSRRCGPRSTASPRRRFPSSPPIPRCVAEIEREVDEVNQRFSHTEQIRRFDAARRRLASRLRRAHAHDEAQATRHRREVRRRDRRPLLLIVRGDDHVVALVAFGVRRLRARGRRVQRARPRRVRATDSTRSRPTP